MKSTKGKWMTIDDFLASEEFISERPDCDHALLVCIQLPMARANSNEVLDAVFDLENILAETIEDAGVGHMDGNEFCSAPDEESVTFFMYGSDANALYTTVLPILSSITVLPGSYIVKQFGRPDEEGMREEKILFEEIKHS